MKRILLSLLLILCMLTACAASAQPRSLIQSKTQYHVDRGPIIVRSIDELLTVYPYVLKGRCLTSSWDKEMQEFTLLVEVETVYQGELNDKQILFKTGQDAFLEGETVFLFVQSWDLPSGKNSCFTGVSLIEGEKGFHSQFVSGIEGYDEAKLVAAIKQGMQKR